MNASGARIAAITRPMPIHAARQPHACTPEPTSGNATMNPTLMAMLRQELAGTALRTSDELGVPSAAKEAYVFAVLGFLTAHRLPGTIASCTGARHASVLGSLTPGRTGLAHGIAPATVPTMLRIETP